MFLRRNSANLMTRDAQQNYFVTLLTTCYQNCMFSAANPAAVGVNGTPLPWQSRARYSPLDIAGCLFYQYSWQEQSSPSQNILIVPTIMLGPITCLWYLYSRQVNLSVPLSICPTFCRFLSKYMHRDTHTYMCILSYLNASHYENTLFSFTWFSCLK